MGIFDDIIATAERTASNVAASAKQSWNTLRTMPETLSDATDSISKGFQNARQATRNTPLQGAIPAIDPADWSAERLLRSTISRGVGQWRGYVQPRIDRTVRDIRSQLPFTSPPPRR